MPQTEVQFYQETSGDVPVLDWLDEIERQDRRVYLKCRSAITRLAALGYELRRPEADLLRDGIYELRVRFRHVNYRLLYFYHGQGVALLAHGLTKEKAVPPAEIERAIERKRRFEADPDAHTYKGEKP